MPYIRTDKIFYHPERVQDWLEKKLIFPITMEIHLTNKCNMKCNYCCFIDRHNKDTLPTLKAKMIIDIFSKIKVKGLIFSGGGEPTVHKDFKEIVKHAFNKNLDIGLITNGLIYPDILEYLTWVRFSLDTFNSEIYKKIKGVDKLHIAEGNIRKAVVAKKKNNLKVTIGVQMVVTKDNYTDIIWMYRYVCDYKADYFQFRPLENADYPNYVWGKVNYALKYFGLNNTDIPVLTSQNKWDEITGSSKKAYKGCPGADLIGAVDARGDFYICCHMVQDESARYGNMIEDDINNMLKNRKNVQNNFDYSKCPIACRGSMINLALVKFNKLKHINFL